MHVLQPWQLGKSLRAEATQAILASPAPTTQQVLITGVEWILKLLTLLRLAEPGHLYWETTLFHSSVAKITHRPALLCFPHKSSSSSTSLITDPSDCSLFRPRSLALRASNQLSQIRISVSGISQLLRASFSVFLSPAFHFWDDPQAQERSQSLTPRHCPLRTSSRAKETLPSRDQSSVQPDHPWPSATLLWQREF